MAKFYSNNTKKLTPLSGRGYATTYHQINDSERKLMFDHVNNMMIELLQHAMDTDNNQMLNDVDAPLKNFPRTGKKPNYSAWDVMLDLRNYLNAGNDPTEGMVGRWNRLFEDFADVQIEFDIGVRPRVQNNFGNLFQLKKG